MAITVGSVEVDIVPNTRGIHGRLRSALVPAGTRAGNEAGDAAGRSFGPAMQSHLDTVGQRIGQQIGAQIAARITSEVRDSISDGVTQGGRAAAPAAARPGSEAGGAFARAARARIQAAMRALPDVDIDADTTPAQAQILRLRAQLARLADQEIGVDIDAGAALAQIQAIQGRLRALSASDADVQVRIDTGQAMGELAAVSAAVSALDGRDIDINVSTRQAVIAVLVLTAALGGLVAIPAVPVLAAGIGSLAAAATAAGAGIGAAGAAAVPALMDIGNALKAQKAAQDAAANATARGGQTAAQAAQRTMQLEAAQQALAAAHRNAGQQIRRAEQGVADAVRQAADANRRAAQQVRDAKTGLAAAVKAAADRQQQAAEQVEDAEQSLADAQRDARQAQRDLTAARREAAEELVDLGNRLTSSRLSEREAELSLADATARLRQVQAAGAKATAQEQARAQLDYDQAVQRLKEQRLETSRLASDKRRADRQGVEGSDQVRSAQERLANAQRSVRDRQEALADAQREAARQQVRSQQDIAAAQQRVAEAQRNVTKVQEDGARSVARAQDQLVAAQQSAAESIAAAQRQIRSAQLSAAGGADTAAAAQAKYRQALAAMTPASRGTFKAFLRLRSAFKGWSRDLQPEIMPIFTRGINGARRALPGLTPFVREAADAVGELQDRASRGFQSKGWKTFKNDLVGGVRPAIVGIGRAIGNIGRGLGGIIGAFLPHMDSIEDRMVSITDRFGDWGQGLRGSDEFEGFLSYSAEMAPVLAEGLGDIGSAFYEISKSLSPLSGPALEILGAMARGVASIAETLPWLVQGIYLVIIATKAWTLAQVVLNAAMTANPITLIIVAIVALVAAVIYAYKRVGWFRTAVQATWNAIKVASLFLWNRVLMPFFDWVGRIMVWLWQKIIKPYVEFMIDYWGRIGSVVLWLWKKIFATAFDAIGKIIRFWWKNIVLRYFKLVRFYVRNVAAVFTWFWRSVIRVVFKAIGAIFSFWWKHVVQRYFDLVRRAIRTLADAFRWLHAKVVKPVWSQIRGAIRAAWRDGIRPVFDTLKKAVGRVADAFREAKDGIGKAWNKLKGLTKKPVKFIIDTVYNKGIVGLWNAAAKVLPIDKLKPFNPKGFATGGPVFGPGTETSDSILAALSTGEHVWTAEEVRSAGGHAAIEAMRAAALRRGRGYARGGPIEPRGAHGGPVDWVGDKIGDVGGNLVGGGVGLLGKVAGKVKDLALGGVYTAVKAAAKPLRALIDKIPGGGSGFGKLAKAVPNGILDAVLDAVKGKEESQLGSGQWIKPVDAPYGTRFGVRGAMWASGRHTGLDFPAPTGRLVRAVDNGSVAYARSGGPYGNHILIQHGKNLASLYAHLSSIIERSGPVQRGQRIGRVGATGNVTGPHLHLEARRGGVPVDPMPYLTGGTGGFNARAVGRNQQIAKTMLGRYGWAATQFGPLKKLWQHESGWNHLARNPSSGAYGIPQSLPASKMASAGSDWRTNPATQIKWGLGYIKGRYGSPASAWSFWQRQSPHWYDQGGWLPPGGIGLNGLREPEAVLTPAQFRAMEGAATAGVTGARGGSTSITYEINARTADFTVADLDRVQRQQYARMRAGRPH
ncbi:peptidoglycan DD-metalloendopeptidase family protein [Streptomyces synnematoformans]|uniref:M23ase beta-sheet core domain-containing protein n=1 Tax=Streptomyces synnematoformans TaxID=415721 RepID=A0ABN2XC29_9ACTN